MAKHRSGAVGDVKLRFVSKYSKFENWNEGYEIMQEALSENHASMESKMNGPDLRRDPAEIEPPF